jgi:hypothetical protein
MYRSGDSGGDEFARDDIDRHHTIEVTCRPSMKSFIVDLWFEGVTDNPDYVCFD